MNAASPSSSGHRRPFPTTRWSLLIAQDAEDERRRESMLRLAEQYWKPVYAYLCQRWRLDATEAADVTQAFFLWAIETELLDRADRSRGRFRTWLKVTLKHFLYDRWRAERRQKRGGDQRILSLAQLPATAFDLPDATGRTPEEVLDSVWRSQVLQRAVHILEEELTSEGRPRTYSIFCDYFLAEEDVDYARLAERYGCKSSDVSNALQAAKKRYRSVLRRVIAETVSSEDELRDELRWFFGPES